MIAREGPGADPGGLLGDTRAYMVRSTLNCFFPTAAAGRISRIPPTNPRCAQAAQRVFGNPVGLGLAILISIINNARCRWPGAGRRGSSDPRRNRIVRPCNGNIRFDGELELTP